MSDAMDRVFSMPELVEPILEFAASGEPWEKTRNLRLVCKSWRDLAIKGLCSSSELPQVDIYTIESLTSDDYAIDEEAIAEFREKYPHNSSLPIHVEVVGYFNSTIYEFLAEFAPIIAELGLTTKRQYTTDEINEELQFNMTNLRKLDVYHNLTLEYPYWNFDSFLEKVVEKAERLSLFKFYFWPIPDMELPEKLTHMQISASVFDLMGLFSYNGARRLIDMELILYPEMEEGREFWMPGVVEFEGIPIFDTVAGDPFPDLERLEVKLRDNVADGPLILPPLEKLKHFSVDLSVAMKDGSRLCDIGTLQSLELELTETGLKDMDLFVAPGAIYKNLKSVSLRNRHSGSLGDNNVLHAIQQVGLPSCPSLESVKLSGFSDAVLFELLPTIYSEWKTIKSLEFGVQRSDNNGSQSSHDLVTFLTGLRRNEVPRQEKLWGGRLKGSGNAITNLSSLEKLTISVRRRVKCKLDRFVFKAAFLTMENLKSIKLGGDIQVDQNMVKEWKADGRKIKTPSKQDDECRNV